MFVSNRQQPQWTKTRKVGLAPGVASKEFNIRWTLKDSKGGDMAEWPADLRDEGSSPDENHQPFSSVHPRHGFTAAASWPFRQSDGWNAPQQFRGHVTLLCRSRRSLRGIASALVEFRQAKPWLRNLTPREFARKSGISGFVHPDGCARGIKVDRIGASVFAAGSTRAIVGANL